MQAVILAAGKGLRFEPLSVTRPKPLFSFMGTSSLEYSLRALDGLIEEVIIIVGYKEEMIREKIGDTYGKMKIRYVEQQDPLGTGAAAKLAEPFISDKFILLNGDDFYSREDIKKVIGSCPCILAAESDHPSSFGVIIKADGKMKELVEKPDNPPSNLVNAGMYCLPKSIFGLEIEKSPRGEYEFTDYVQKFKEENPVKVIEASFWMPASCPWDIFKIATALFSQEKKKIKGKIERGATINGEVIIGEGSLIKSGAYIEGPVYIGKNCIIGPNCYLRENSFIEDGCRIGQAVEIKNSIIGRWTNVSHLSYVGDSIIGEGCNLGAGTIVANLRHDGQNVKMICKGVLTDTGRRKMGTIMGDGSKTGVGTLIYPGKKIWPGRTTMPGERVDKDII